MLRLEIAGPMSDRIIYEDEDGTDHTLFIGTLNRDEPGFVALWQLTFAFNVAQDDTPQDDAPKSPQHIDEEWRDIRYQYERDEWRRMYWDDVMECGEQDD